MNAHTQSHTPALAAVDEETRRAAADMLNLVTEARDRAGDARSRLVRRLADLVLLPEGHLTPQERRLVDQILLRLVGHIELDLRIRLAERFARSQDAPLEVVVRLASDVIHVARPLLSGSPVLDDAELLAIVRACGPEHWAAIAERGMLSTIVTDALVDTAEPETALRLARNKGAHFSRDGYARLVRLSRKQPALRAPLLARNDLTPILAHTMFWWVSERMRLEIVNKFAADRRVLRHALDDAIAEGLEAFADEPELMRALGMIAQPRRYGPSPGEELIAAARLGLREAVKLLTNLAGIRRQTAAHIIADRGGEALAVAAKALGLTRREYLSLALVVEAKHDSTPRPTAELERLGALFDQVATDRADVVLRYWDDIWGNAALDARAAA